MRDGDEHPPTPPQRGSGDLWKIATVLLLGMVLGTQFSGQGAMAPPQPEAEATVVQPTIDTTIDDTNPNTNTNTIDNTIDNSINIDDSIDNSVNIDDSIDNSNTNSNNDDNSINIDDVHSVPSGTAVTANSANTEASAVPVVATIHTTNNNNNGTATASSSGLLSEYYTGTASNEAYDPFRDDLFTARYSDTTHKWETERYEESFLGRDYQIKAPNASEPTRGVLGFIRIQKTGSTTILQKLLTRETGPLYKCFRGHTDGTDFPDDLYAKHIDCQHLSFGHLFNRWKDEVLPAVHRDLPPDDEGMSYTLQVFTMVRDPFDRLLSLFKYMRRRPTWHAMTTDEHVEFLKAGDVKNWAEAMYKRPPTPPRYGIPLQANYFTLFKNLSHIEEGIPLVQGGHPRILALIHECFDASVLLLRERFPRFVREEDVLAFLDLDYDEKSLNHKKNDTDHSLEIEQEGHEDELQELRDRTREWAKGDYDFYDAAVAQFREHLKASSVRPDIVADCLEHLDDPHRRHRRRRWRARRRDRR